MAQTLLNQGITAIRDSLKTLVTHVGVSTDTTAQGDTQTDLSPGAATDLIKASTEANVDFQTFDATISIDGTSEFTNLVINTIGILDGATSADAMSRTVRTQGIGVQAGDTFTIGVRVTVSDAG